MSLIDLTWTSAKGAGKMAAAYLAGDKADFQTIVARRAVCKKCPDRVRTKVPVSDWCGQPFTETPTTCGCLLAGKTAVKSEACPQGKW